MGTELEFIDISKDEENEIPRASNGSNARRMPGSAPQRKSRNSVMIDMEGYRRPEKDGRMPERRVREPEAEMPVRRRMRPEAQVQERRRPAPEGRRLRTVTPMLPEEPAPSRRRPRTVTPMLPDDARPPKRRTRTAEPMLPEEPVRRRSGQGACAPQGRTARRRPRPADPEAEREKAARRRRRRRKRIAAQTGTMLFLATLIAGTVFLLYKLLIHSPAEKEPKPVINATAVQREEVIEANDKSKPVITEDFLTVNEYSRPGEALEQVNNIFVHYTANPGTSAAQNRSYFENLGITGETSASAHFVIGYDGEIIQCIPLDEIAYAVMKRNYDSISIECCYLTEDGKFTDATYQSLIRLCAWLLNEYDLAPEDMMRHYDEGGKKCPLYYVENEEAWNQFLRDLEKYIMDTQV